MWLIDDPFPRDCSEDMYAPDIIDMLVKSNIDFARHEEMGILPDDFAELLITSGLVLSEDTKWLAYARYAYQSTL